MTKEIQHIVCFPLPNKKVKLQTTAQSRREINDEDVDVITNIKENVGKQAEKKTN